MPDKKETIMILLSNLTTPPDEARKLWPDTPIGMKLGFPVPGRGLMNVFFPAVEEMRRENGGWKISWPWLKKNLRFEDYENGVLKGVYVR